MNYNRVDGSEIGETSERKSETRALLGKLDLLIVGRIIAATIIRTVWFDNHRVISIGGWSNSTRCCVRLVVVGVVVVVGTERLG